MTFLNSKLGPKTIQLQYTPEAWSICALQDLPKNVGRIVKIVHIVSPHTKIIEWYSIIDRNYDHTLKAEPCFNEALTVQKKCCYIYREGASCLVL